MKIITRDSAGRRRRARHRDGRVFPGPVNARTAPRGQVSCSSSGPLRHASIPLPARPDREPRHAEKDLREAVIRIAVTPRERAEESQSGNHYAALHSWLSPRLGFPEPLSTTLERRVVGGWRPRGFGPPFRGARGGFSAGFRPSMTAVVSAFAAVRAPSLKRHALRLVQSLRPNSGSWPRGCAMFVVARRAARPARTTSKERTVQNPRSRDR